MCKSPILELLGDMLLELNKPKDVLAAYEENLKGHPNRFNGLYGAAITAKQLENYQKATFCFNQLIELTNGSNSERSEVKEAKTFLNQAI